VHKVRTNLLSVVIFHLAMSRAVFEVPVKEPETRAWDMVKAQCERWTRGTC
jgi:hypothetical protein